MQKTSRAADHDLLKEARKEDTADRHLRAVMVVPHLRAVMAVALSKEAMVSREGAIPSNREVMVNSKVDTGNNRVAMANLRSKVGREVMVNSKVVTGLHHHHPDIKARA